MNNLGTIFTVAFLVLVALSALRGFSKGKKFIWQYTLVRMIVRVLSALIAILVAKKAAVSIASALYEGIANEAFSPETAEILAKLESIPAVVTAVFAMILAPILFYPIRFIFKIILKCFSPLIMKLVMAISSSLGAKRAARAEAKAASAPSEETAEGTEMSTEETAAQASETNDEAKEESVSTVELAEDAPEEYGDKKKKQKKVKGGRKAKYYAEGKNPVGICLGIASAVLGVIIFLAPITGGISVIGSMVGVLANNEIDGIGEDVKPIIEIADSVTNNAAVKINNYAGGKLIYNALTTYKIGSEKATLSKEVNLLAKTADAAFVILDENADSNAKSEAVNNVSAAFDKSEILPTVISEFISGAATAWSEGNEFMGIALPGNENELLGSIFTDAAAIFKNSTPDTVKEDFKTILDVLVVVVNNGVLEETDDPMQLIGNKAFVSDILYLFFENDRLSSLVSGLIDNGISMLTDMLGVPKDIDTLYDSMISAILALNASEDEAALAASIKATFAKYGIDVTNESAENIAAELNDSYGLALEDADADGIKIHITAVKAIVDGAEKEINFGTVNGFKGATVIMTSDAITASHGKTVTDSRKEADALADIFASISTLSTLFSGDGSLASMLTVLGESLDKFVSTEMIGKACVDNLVIALLQSETVESALSMNPLQATAFAKSVIKGTANKSYASIMADIANTIDVLANVSSSETITSESIKDAIATLTPESASALKEMVTPDLVGSLGVGEEAAEGVANVLSGVFENIASAKDAGMSDDEFEAETEKISNILNVTMAMGDGSQNSDDIEFEDYVNDVMDSKILTSTIVDSVYADSDEPQMDPLNTGMEISEEQKTTLVSTLQGKLDESDGENKAETEKTVIAVAAYMNVKIAINENGEIIVVSPEAE